MPQGGVSFTPVTAWQCMTGTATYVILSPMNNTSLFNAAYIQGAQFLGSFGNFGDAANACQTHYLTL